MMPDTIIESLVSQLPNLAGFIMLSATLWTLLRAAIAEAREARLETQETIRQLLAMLEDDTR